MRLARCNDSPARRASQPTRPRPPPPDAAGYGTVAVDLAAEAKKLKEAAANAKPGDPLYVHQPGQNVPPPVA